MKAYNPRRPLISLHIPKCGGTSFRDVLAGWFGNNLHLHYPDWSANRPPPVYNLRRRLPWRYRHQVCIHGHFDRRRFGVADYYPQVDQFITIVRDPLELACSRYFFSKRQGAERRIDGRPAPIAEQFASLDDFLLAHTGDFFTWYLPEAVTPESFEALLTTRFVYIGIMEDLQGSVDALARRLAMPPATVPHKNESPRDETVSPAVRAAFIAAHPVDYAIYDFARAHYLEG